MSKRYIAPIYCEQTDNRGTENIKIKYCLEENSQTIMTFIRFEKWCRLKIKNGIFSKKQNFSRQIIEDGWYLNDRFLRRRLVKNRYGCEKNDRKDEYRNKRRIARILRGWKKRFVAVEFLRGNFISLHFSFPSSFARKRRRDYR